MLFKKYTSPLSGKAATLVSGNMHFLGRFELVALLIVVVLLFRPKGKPPVSPVSADNSAHLRRIRLFQK
jgi:hypothetical protein